MSSIWVAASVLQWVVIVLLVVLALALLRQIGSLALRLDTLGRSGAGVDVALGTPIAVQRVELLGGSRSFTLGGRRTEATVVVFVSPTCANCATLAPALRELAAGGDPSLLLVVVAAAPDAERYLSEYGLTSIPTALIDAFPEQYRPQRSVPFVFAVGRDGVVVASGHPAAAEDLREVIASVAAVAPGPSGADEAMASLAPSAEAPV